MKSIAKGIIAAFAAVVCMLGSISASAQEWSAAQKDVWKSVEAYWALDAAGNTEAFMAYFHADYMGWSLDNAVPGNKASATKFIAHQHKSGKTLVYDITPAAIKIHGDVAFVHYHYTQVTKDSMAKEKQTSGRWTDILKKQGEKWVLIGDSGGRTSKD